MNVYSVTNANGEFLSKFEVEELLKQIGISDDAIETGTEDAIEQDSTTNGIDLTQITDLALKQGAEVKGSADTVKKDFEAELESLGIPIETIAQGQDAVEAYASQNGITLPPPPSGTQLNIQL